MVLKLKGRTNYDESYVKSITFHLSDSSRITLYRNITEYCIDRGYLEMNWIGCFWNGPRGHDYALKPSYFRDAKIIDIGVNEDAPKGYLFLVDSWTVTDS